MSENENNGRTQGEKGKTALASPGLGEAKMPLKWQPAAAAEVGAK